jgi:hypothetical protein
MQRTVGRGRNRRAGDYLGHWLLKKEGAVERHESDARDLTIWGNERFIRLFCVHILTPTPRRLSALYGRETRCTTAPAKSS